MIFESPVPYGYDSEPHYCRPAYQQCSPSFYNQKRRYLQQLRDVEGEKRRVEAERYQRTQAARQDYISRLQEEEASRQAYAAAKRRREVEEAKQVEQYLYGGAAIEESEKENEVTEPVFRTMQGLDGTFYKVKAVENTRPRRKPRRRNSRIQSRASLPPAQAEDTFQLIRGPDGLIYQVKLQPQPRKEETKQAPPIRSTSIRKSIAISRGRSTSGKDKRNQKHSMLVVEDASDSESDHHDNHKSLWRNRRPSPGQWMEPVQSSSQNESKTF
jgi:hypothetical protein